MHKLSLVAESGYYSLVVVCGLLISVASLVEHGLKGAKAFIVVVHGLSCPAAREIFPEEGSNLCPLHWQVDSQPLNHQRSSWYTLIQEGKKCAQMSAMLDKDVKAKVW